MSLNNAPFSSNSSDTQCGPFVSVVIEVVTCPSRGLRSERMFTTMVCSGPMIWIIINMCIIWEALWCNCQEQFRNPNDDHLTNRKRILPLASTEDFRLASLLHDASPIRRTATWSFNFSFSSRSSLLILRSSLFF